MKLLEDVPLAPKTTLGVGGRARFYCNAASESELEAALDWARRHRTPLSILGGGSNVVIADEGFDGLVVRMALTGVETEPQEDRVCVRAMAGESWDEFVTNQVAKELQGLECLSGIPGLVGATPIQNVGAYGQEVSETIVEVRALNVATGEYTHFSNRDCKFAYRDSAFKRELRGQYVVTRVDFELSRGAAPAVRYEELARAIEANSRPGAMPSLSEVASLVRELRRKKSMLLVSGDENSRSCGSFFVNPVVPRETLERVRQVVGSANVPSYPESDGRVKLPAAWLIEQSGLGKGHNKGRVGLSTRHTLALVCHDGASAQEVVAFAREVRARVEEHFGILMVPEPAFWGFAALEHGLPSVA